MRRLNQFQMRDIQCDLDLVAALQFQRLGGLPDGHQDVRDDCPLHERQPVCCAGLLPSVVRAT
jgi:hypothetical protein